MATPLPSTAALTTPPSSHAAMRTNFANLRAFLAGLLGGDGKTATALATLGALFASHLSVAAATTAQVLDRGKIFNCTGTWALTLPSVASAGAGWCIIVRNAGTGTITLTPTAPTLIDGAATMQVATQRTVVVACTGTDYITLPFYPSKIGAQRILGNNGAASATPKELTPDQLAALLPIFTDTAKGLVPAGSGSSSSVLRGNGQWSDVIDLSAMTLTGTRGQFDVALIDDAFLYKMVSQTIGGTKTFDGAFVLAGRAVDPEAPPPGQLWFDAGTGHIKANVGDEVRRLDGQAEIPMLVPVAGDYVMTTLGAGGGALGVAMGYPNQMDLYPFIPRADMPVASLAVNCTTGVAGALGKFVIYESDEFGRPAALILETTTVNLASAGVKTAALGGFSMRAGRTYWLGFRYSATASISTWPITATPDINGGAPSTSARNILRRYWSFATAAAATWGFVSEEINAAAAPAIWLKL